MPDPDEWFAPNRAMWDERVPLHVDSRFYDVEGFKAGRDPLRPLEIEEVGDVTGKSLLHLQCHFGLDTLAWARHGARVTGLDFSLPAVETARALATALALDADFVAGNVYDAPALLTGRTFDVVYTGGGALCWLPDIPRWASVVASLVRPGGFFYLMENHPLTAILGDDDLTVAYDYFHSEPMRWDEPGSYVDRAAQTSSNVSYEWVHPLGEVVTSLIAAGLRLDFLHESDSIGWQRWPFLEQRDGTYRMPPGKPAIPMMYSLKATRPD